MKMSSRPGFSSGWVNSSTLQAGSSAFQRCQTRETLPSSLRIFSGVSRLKAEEARVLALSLTECFSQLPSATSGRGPSSVLISSLHWFTGSYAAPQAKQSHPLWAQQGHLTTAFPFLGVFYEPPVTGVLGEIKTFWVGDSTWGNYFPKSALCKIKTMLSSWVLLTGEARLRKMPDN